MPTRCQTCHEIKMLEEVILCSDGLWRCGDCCQIYEDIKVDKQKGDVGA